MTPDKICGSLVDRGLTITVRDIDDAVLIEGSRAALEGLSELVRAQAAAKDCGFQASPTGAGKALFSKESTRGLYIHRVED